MTNNSKHYNSLMKNILEDSRVKGMIHAFGHKEGITHNSLTSFLENILPVAFEKNEAHIRGKILSGDINYSHVEQTTEEKPTTLKTAFSQTYHGPIQMLPM